jgi:hypothetical protein
MHEEKRPRIDHLAQRWGAPTLLTPAQLAQRWGAHPDTIRKHLQRGLLRPVFGEGKSARYALAQVQAIEAGGGIHEIYLQPLKHDQRCNPLTVLEHLRTAADAVSLAQRQGHKDFDHVREALAELVDVVDGRSCGGAARPVYPAASYVGVNLDDEGAPAVLADIAQAALARLTSNWETSRMLAQDLGPLTRERVCKEVKGLRKPLEWLDA